MKKLEEFKQYCNIICDELNVQNVSFGLIKKHFYPRINYNRKKGKFIYEKNNIL